MGCLMVFVLLGALGTVGAIAENEWGAAAFGAFAFVVLPTLLVYVAIKEAAKKESHE